MEKITQKDLLEAGVHFGHLKKKWNPKMAPYIFMERRGIHLIDLNKTMEKLEETAAALKNIARSGKKILFVATKKQAKEIVQEVAQRVNMPYVTERWLGGMLTNFSTIRKSIKKMQNIDKMFADGTLENVTKKERLTLMREKTKIENVLGGVASLNRIPAAVFMVDISHEHIALFESKKLNVTTFAMVDTNSDPNKVDFAIPANDDAAKSISIIVNYLADAIIEGLADRKKDKEESDKEGGEEGAEGGDNFDRGFSKDEEIDEERGKKQRVMRSRTGGGSGAGGGQARTGGGAGGNRNTGGPARRPGGPGAGQRPASAARPK